METNYQSRIKYDIEGRYRGYTARGIVWEVKTIARDYYIPVLFTLSMIAGWSAAYWLSYHA